MGSLRCLCLAVLLASVGTSVPAQRDSRQQGLQAAGAALDAGHNARAIRLLRSLGGRKADLGINHMLAVAHSRLGASKAGSGDLRGAATSILAAIRCWPDEPALLLSLADVQIRLGQMRAAERRLQRVLKLEPNHPEALAMLGQIAAAADDKTKAGSLYQAASRAAPDQTELAWLAERFERERKAEAGYVTRRLGGFILEYPDNSGARAAASTAEAWLKGADRDLRRVLGAAPQRPVTVVLYDGEDFDSMSHAQHWAKAYYDGKVRLDLDSSEALRSRMRRTLRHELAHAYLHELYGDLPNWVHEGFAQSIQGLTAGTAGSRFRNGEPLLTRELFLNGFAYSQDITVVNAGYDQALMAVGFLLRGHDVDRFRNLCAELGRGSSSEDALRAIYGINIAQLLERALQNR